MATQETDQFLAIARVVKAQGRRGEVWARILTDFPARFVGLSSAFLENPGRPPEPVQVEGAWPHKGGIVLKFTGIDSIGRAEQLAGLHVLVSREKKMPLAPHHYYLWELEGCQVVTEREGVQTRIGTVTDVESTGGVDLLHVSRDDGRGGEILIPLAQAICTRIDPQTKTILIEPPEDLLNLNE